MLELFHIEHREVYREAMSRRVVKLQQLTFSPDGELFGLDHKGRVWVWARNAKEWYQVDNPIEDDEIENETCPQIE